MAWHRFRAWVRAMAAGMKSVLAMTVAAGLSTAVVSLPFSTPTPSPTASQTAGIVTAPLAVRPVEVQREIVATNFSAMIAAVGTGVAEPFADTLRLTLLLLPQRLIRQPE